MRPVLKKTIVDEIVNSVMDAIRSGEMKPGDRFPSERALAEQWSVSRASVREAMKALSYANIIVIKPGDGTYLTRHDAVGKMGSPLLSSTPDPKDLTERVEARIILERHLARLATERITPKALSEMEKSLDKIEKARQKKDVATLIDADYEFHRKIAEAAQSRYLQQAYDNILLSGPEWLAIREESFQLRASTADNHWEIFEAIKSGDPDAAEEKVCEHGKTILWRYRRYIKQDSE